MKKKNKLYIYKDVHELSMQAASLFAAEANKNIFKKGFFTVVLSGGTTPLETYKILASKKYKHTVDWNNVYFFWGDERYVPYNSSENNAYIAINTWLKKINIPSKNILRIPTNLSPQKCAAVYEKKIRKFFKNNEIKFDFIFLGLGTDGHTASLFPDSPALTEKEKLVCAVYEQQKKQYRITLTPKILNSSETIIFLITGKEKAGMAKKIIRSKKINKLLPATYINPANGKLIFMLDTDAALKLNY